MPIELTDFEATVVEDQTELNWATLSEFNSDYFQVERSEDGQNFLPIGKVQSVGNSTQRIDYQLRDLSPIVGLNYYRLLQMDHDGCASYSKVITIEFNSGEEKNSSIYPNPVNDVLTLQLAHEIFGKVQVHIVDVTGRLVKKFVVSSESTSNLTTDIDMKILRQGIYYLKVISTKRTEVLAFKE